MKNLPNPDEKLNCLLVQPKFSQNNFWNYTSVAHAVGAKTPAAPLGLLTVAALLPQHWQFTLVDLNVRPITAAEWDAADLICVGGMLPQQPGILEVIQRGRASNKFVVVGGADPSSQPDIYAAADARVLGEGENTIELWLESWREGEPSGVFSAPDRPSVTTAPIPRFDLIRASDYVHIGVQFSRGCPFNCEFCDIIELYGRIPRSKTADQFIAELEALYQSGYRGWVDIVDDNFVGNKRVVKPMLQQLSSWSQERGYPFFFSTEATMNLADDEEMLEMMRDVEFRYLFMGIETPDPKLLAATQKRVNAMAPIAERIDRIYANGIAVSAGFILGFDEEQGGNDQALVACIESTGIVVAMIGLLVALPNTQLARRLLGEKRLLSAEMDLMEPDNESYQLVTAGSHAEGADQAAGLNFVTTRDRVEIYREYQNVLARVYDPKHFMDRVLSTTSRIKIKRRHRPGLKETWRDLRALAKVAWWMTGHKGVRRYYWRNTLRTAWMGVNQFDFAQSMMLMFTHLGPQSEHVRQELETNIDYAKRQARYPRQTSAHLPVVSAEPV